MIGRSGSWTFSARGAWSRRVRAWRKNGWSDVPGGRTAPADPAPGGVLASGSEPALSRLASRSDGPPWTAGVSLSLCRTTCTPSCCLGLARASAWIFFVLRMACDGSDLFADGGGLRPVRCRLVRGCRRGFSCIWCWPRWSIALLDQIDSDPARRAAAIGDLRARWP